MSIPPPSKKKGEKDKEKKNAYAQEDQFSTYSKTDPLFLDLSLKRSLDLLYNTHHHHHLQSCV